MANVLLARGGSPDFKGWFCAGQAAEYGPPYHALHQNHTPPFDSHADGAYGQGWLNLHFPLVPNLAETTAHAPLRNLLKGLSADGDIVWTNWVPGRAFIDSLYIEVSKTDDILGDVTITPIAHRVGYNFSTKEFEYTENTAFNDELAAASAVTSLKIGTVSSSDPRYIFARLVASTATNPPSTFSHNIVTTNAAGEPTGGFDEYFGNVIIGYKFTGDAAAIAKVWQSNIAVYSCAKLIAFEGATQIA